MRLPYNPALDGIRALAVLAVMAFHLQFNGMRGGFLGVEVFFVLSGYLITTLLLHDEANGGVRLGHFYLRRARRLYPALLGMVALYLIAWPTFKALQDAGMALTYISDFTMAHMGRPDVLEHTWSLSIEEHYYLLWPLLLPFVAKLPRRVAVYLLLGVFLASTLWRMYVDQYIGPPVVAGFRFDCRLSGLALGCAIAFLPTVPKWLLWAAMAAFTALAAWFWIPPGFILPIELGPAMTLAQLAAAAWVLLVASGGMKPLGLLAYVGRISYGLYLYHWPVERWLMTVTRDPWTIVLWTVVLTFGLAILSYHTIETWCRSVRRVEPLQPQPNQADGYAA